MNATRRNASPYSCLAARDSHERIALSLAPVEVTPSPQRRSVVAGLALSRFFGGRVDGSVLDKPHPENRSRKRLGFSGFTVIELMIVVVIIAILAMIAYPSYEDHLRKGRRSAAQNLLADIATRQQQYLLDARQYAVGAGALGALNVTVPADVSPFYTVAINPAAPTLPPSFTLVATPIAGSKQVPDGALTLDSAGNKTRNGQPGWK